MTLALTVSSFGYKFGAMPDADWVVDSRMLRNPFWEPELRPLTGLDERVRAYVLDQPEALRLVEWLSDVLRWAAPLYVERGRSALHLAIGCTGGRHRSVVLSEALAARLSDDGLTVSIRHRDVDKPDPRDG
ncbi:MAG: hypothetical protein E6J45_01770 [Chloroflexi bacterium]|nr:MAG: hypothetical protein E6J45_01770 [Chloroflexota bacterium]